MRIRILYAEDSLVVRKVLSNFINASIRKHFTGTSIEVELITAKSGTQAQSILEENPPNFFTIFFMDDELDDGPLGREIIESLPKLGYSIDKVIVIAVSSDLQESNPDHERDVEQAKSLGYSYFLPKPTSAFHVDAVIAKLLPTIKASLESELERPRKDDDDDYDHAREVVSHEEGAGEVFLAASMMHMAVEGGSDHDRVEPKESLAPSRRPL